MPLAYYLHSVPKEFWSEHWGGQDAEVLLQVARRSPLTALIEAALPRSGQILEAGCGLGQYVRLFRERGYRAVGVDLSFKALRECYNSSPAAPLAAMDLRRLGCRSSSLSAYISLGVVEHDPEGPDAILREARRVLEPGGVLILSVPYINGVRRLGTWWARRRNRRVLEIGGGFYQFAFSRPEARAFLERNGFYVVSATPYDPARILRGALRRVSWLARIGGASRSRSPQTAKRELCGGVGSRQRAAPSGVRKLLRRLLYTRPSLHAFGHMILFVAVKAD